jgi:hypothetical protein
LVIYKQNTEPSAGRFGQILYDPLNRNQSEIQMEHVGTTIMAALMVQAEKESCLIFSATSLTRRNVISVIRRITGFSRQTRSWFPWSSEEWTRLLGVSLGLEQFGRRDTRTRKRKSPSQLLRGHILISGAATNGGGGTMRVRYQQGYLRLGRRKNGPDCWEFLWWDNELIGKRACRKAVIGNIQQYPNVEDAWQASNGLRVSINETRNRQREQTITMADLIDHYDATELALDLVDGGKSHATKIIYRDFFRRWVKPTWGSLNIRAVRTTAVEQWLRQLARVDGSRMAPSTKAKIRNVMSVLFNHAIRHEWLEQGRNPILLVRQSAKRQRIPEYLDPEELRALLEQLDRCAAARTWDTLTSVSLPLP